MSCFVGKLRVLANILAKRLGDFVVTLVYVGVVLFIFVLVSLILFPFKYMRNKVKGIPLWCLVSGGITLVVGTLLEVMVEIGF